MKCMRFETRLRAEAISALVAHLNKLDRPMSRREVEKEMLVEAATARSYMQAIDHSGQGLLLTVSRWKLICPLAPAHRGSLQYHKVLAYGRKHKTFTRHEATLALPAIPRGTIASSLARAVRRDVFERLGGGTYRWVPPSIGDE
jgi:hypothetical protein